MSQQLKETQTDKAVELFNKGDFKRSFAIFKTFKSGLSKAEISTIGVAAECLNGQSHNYKQLKIDTDAEIENAKEIIKSYIKKYCSGK